MIEVPFYGNLITQVLSGGPFPANADAVRLLLGTCAQESQFVHRRQLGRGPARGYMQCEPATEKDMWKNYLAHRPALRDFLTSRCGVTGPNAYALEHNMVYQILLARVHYYRRDPDPLPDADDVEEAARRWKHYYNTPKGGGTEAQYLTNYTRLVRPYYGPAV